MKIFGDLHGQFGDLMRLFEEYGTPSTAGDIPYIDYLFLGDYVDRGAHSLETICLLLALKVEHPTSVHLIRGNHEARALSLLTAQLWTLWLCWGVQDRCPAVTGSRGRWSWFGPAVSTLFPDARSLSHATGLPLSRSFPCTPPWRVAPLCSACTEAPASLQASDINALFGFRLECLERLGEAGVWAWTRMNALFNWLPLAALVEDRIMCMHGGMPSALNPKP